MKTAAFFDLDKTLLTVNSGALWMRRERREGRISRWQVAQASFYLVAYKFGVLDMERAMRKALQTVKGIEEETVRGWTRTWFREEVASHAAPGAWSVIEEHRKRGELLVLLTSSSPYESEIASEHFGLDAFISTRYEIRDGVFTGELVRPVCYGAGKVVLAERFCRERNLDLEAGTFYSDSLSDLPMFERVRHPRVVHPDPRLKRLAARRRWPVLDWTRG